MVTVVTQSPKEDIGAVGNDGNTLGGLIRLLRQQNGWTLRQMSQKVGVPLSTLAKVEADKLSLPYDKLQQFTARLGMTMTEFLSLADKPSTGLTQQIVTGRRSLATSTTSIQVQTRNYDYEYLCADLRDKRMVPMIIRIRSHSVDQFGEAVSHRGEEFVYVLEGTVEVHLQFYTPFILKVGQGVYLDSTMGHSYNTKDCDSALIMCVCSNEGPDLARELISLAENEALQFPSSSTELPAKLSLQQDEIPRQRSVTKKQRSGV